MKYTDQEIARHVERIATAMPECDIHCQRERLPAELVRLTPVGPRYIQLQLKVSSALIASHTRPGQYVTLSTDTLQPRFFVLTNAPDVQSDRWEFLLDAASEAGQVFQQRAVGSPVSVTRPEGSGFPADQVAGKQVLLFTTGSGIATMRGVLDYWHAHPALRPAAISLYYGESASTDFAYQEEMERWKKQGVQIYLTEEQRDMPEPGQHRYVQDVFDETPPELHNTVVFLSGAGIMMRIVSEKLLRLGLGPEHLYTNV